MESLKCSFLYEDCCSLLFTDCMMKGIHACKGHHQLHCSKKGCVDFRGITTWVCCRLELCSFVTNSGTRQVTSLDKMVRMSPRQSADNFHRVWGSPSDSSTSQCLIPKLFLLFSISWAEKAEACCWE